MSSNNHIKCLYALNFLLFLGLVALAYQNLGNGIRPTARQISEPTAPAQFDKSKIVVGHIPNGIHLVGKITKIEKAGLELKDSSGKLIEVSTNDATQFEIGGKLKDRDAINQEMSEYNAKVKTLMNNPSANHAELAALRVPSPMQIRNAALSDFVAGDNVAVTPTSSDSKGPYTALKVFKSTVLLPAPPP